MPKEERPIDSLAQFLPPGAAALVLPFFKEHVIYLSLTRERKSVLGDYRHPSKQYPYHRISVNANLNVYSLLITLLHEVAHLITYEHYQNRVSPHGKEWKTKFQETLLPFTGKKIFPPDVEAAINAYLQNPAASTCTDPQLFKALAKYDKAKPGWKFVDDIHAEQQFETEDGRRFVKIHQLRTRSKCRDISTGKIYLFPGVAVVKLLQKG